MNFLFESPREIFRFYCLRLQLIGINFYFKLSLKLHQMDISLLKLHVKKWCVRVLNHYLTFSKSTC